jgi:hypothetical protein
MERIIRMSEQPVETVPIRAGKLTPPDDMQSFFSKVVCWFDQHV